MLSLGPHEGSNRGVETSDDAHAPMPLVAPRLGRWVYYDFALLVPLASRQSTGGSTGLIGAGDIIV